jgi:hypothetical protein
MMTSTAKGHTGRSLKTDAQILLSTHRDECRGLRFLSREPVAGGVACAALVPVNVAVVARAKTIGTYRDVSVQPWTPPSAQPTSPLLGADQVSTSAASSAHFRMRTVSMRSRSSSAVFWKRVP